MYKRKKARKRPKSSAAVELSNSEYMHGYVLLHGIGPTKHGSTLEGLAHPAVEMLTEAYGARARWRACPDVAGQKAATFELDGEHGETTRFLFVESRWTDLTSAPRFTMTAFWWSILGVLTLLPYLMAPGAKELAEGERTLKD
jgi:hypothetical protein